MAAATAEKEKKTAKQGWTKLMTSALDADTWGQSIEASEQYEKLSSLLERQIPDLSLTIDERSHLLKLKHCIELRTQLLKSQDDDEENPVVKPSQELKLEEMKLIARVLEDLFVRPITDFPILLHDYTVAVDTKKIKTNEQVIIAEEKGPTDTENPSVSSSSSSSSSGSSGEMDPSKAGGTLKPPPKAKVGQTTVSFNVEKIGLKDSESYIAPQISVVLADQQGRLIEQQDTPPSKDQKPLYVNFNETIHVQCPLEDIQSKKLTVFFEFKHYKPKKKKISTRCYAVMEFDEIIRAAGQAAVCLELYKKPVEYQKKKFSLFTEKKLYMHVSVVLTKH